jgi:flagellar basal body rod protein FlgG
LSLVEFADPGTLVRETGALLRSDEAAPVASENSRVRTGSLEQSNVSVVDRVAELTSVSRSFQALQKAVSVLMNDIDGRAVESLGRR